MTLFPHVGQTTVFGISGCRRMWVRTVLGGIPKREAISEAFAPASRMALISFLICGFILPSLFPKGRKAILTLLPKPVNGPPAP